MPDIGVEPFADLASWFASDVAPKVCHVALVPEENAGVLSYLASHLFSGFRFRRHGLVAGDDVLSTIARAEYYLNEKDLDSAARELNQLKGPAKTLLHDWLEAARRRLEVEQALEVSFDCVCSFALNKANPYSLGCSNPGNISIVTSCIDLWTLIDYLT